MAACRDNTTVPLKRTLCWHCSLANSTALVEKGCSAEAWPQVSCSHAWQSVHVFEMTCSYKNQVLRLLWQCWLSAQKWFPAWPLDKLQRKPLTVISRKKKKKKKNHVHTNLKFWRHGRGRGVGEKKSSHVAFTEAIDKDRPVIPRNPTGLSWQKI